MYHRGDIYNKEQRTCPHCGQKIQAQTWDKFIIPALGTAIDANIELAKDHTGMHTALFSFDVIADHLYENRRQQTEYSCPVKDLLEQFST